MNYVIEPFYKQQGWKPEQIGDVPYLMLTLLFTCAVFVFEFYLDVRQLSLFRSSKEVPAELKGSVPNDTFLKSLSYGSDKFSFGLIEGTITFIEGIILVLLGFLPFFWDTAANLATSYHLISDSNSAIMKEMIITAIFFCLLTLHDTLFNLPFALYKTFVVEQKHGFNQSTLGLFFRDKLIMIGLSLGLGAPILSVVVYIIRMGGPHFYFYVWSFLCIISIIMMTIYPTVIAPLFNKYTKLDSGPIYDAIEQLAKKVEFPLTQIFVVDGSKRSAHSNAYFYGFFKNKRIVLFDTLMKQVELPELLAILGHEIGW
jgi:STE24 endopeptidase